MATVKQQALLLIKVHLVNEQDNIKSKLRNNRRAINDLADQQRRLKKEVAAYYILIK